MTRVLVPVMLRWKCLLCGAETRPDAAAIEHHLVDDCEFTSPGARRPSLGVT